ncbi:MAG TPA: hypothetical protein VFW38_03135 [Solirubrobacteraceae bacterium]|nr:hypothetical protein [Solirubrobacteraceae bacterium]
MLLALAALAILGYPTRAVGIGGVVLLAGLLAALSYTRYRRGPLPPARAELDRLMLVVLLLSVGLASVTSIVVLIVGSPVSASGIGVDVWLTVPSVITAVIYVSSLLDWYLVLPRLGGLGSWPLPCTVEVAKDTSAWRLLTQFWFGQRLVTEFLSVASIDGAAIYLSVADGRNAALWFAIASVATIAASVLAVAWAQGWSGLHNPNLKVGGFIRASRPSWEPQTQALYALDIDLRRIGAMFVTPARCGQDGQQNSQAAFTITDAEVKLSDVFDPVVSYDPPCAATCTGINWYCRNNPRAYESK